MKVTIYTIPDCQFCKQEKDYLTSKNIQFEEKNVQENREFLSEMLEVSNKFAGVPFTVVEKDDGQKVMLKGFTQSEFDQALGGGATPAAAAPAQGGDQAAQTQQAAPAAQPAASTSQASVGGDQAQPAVGSPTMPSVDQAQPAQGGDQTGSTTADETAAKAQNELDGILANLNDKAAPAGQGATPAQGGNQAAQTQQAAPAAPAQPAAPAASDNQAQPAAPAAGQPQSDASAQAPNIPDFPQKQTS